MTDFPWRKYTKNDLLNEYEKLGYKILETNIDISKPLSYSLVGLKCSNYFFQYERMKTPSQGKISCYDFWKEKKEKIKKYHEKYTRDISGTISFLNHAPSQFPVFRAGLIYEYFHATKVFDPYAGWGDRCLAAMALDIDYIGIDSNKKLKPSYDKMIKFYPTDSNVKIFYSKAEKINIDKLDFDFVLTSPPFWGKSKKLLEEYNGTESDYDVFLEQSLIPVVDDCLRKDVWICLYIPEDMYKDLKKASTVKINTIKE